MMRPPWLRRATPRDNLIYALLQAEEAVEVGHRRVPRLGVLRPVAMAIFRSDLVIGRIELLGLLRVPPVWKSTSERHRAAAVTGQRRMEPPQGRRRVDGVGLLNFDFHTASRSPASTNLIAAILSMGFVSSSRNVPFSILLK